MSTISISMWIVAIILFQYCFFTYIYSENEGCKRLDLGRYRIIYHDGVRMVTKTQHRAVYDLILVASRHLLADQGYILRYYRTTKRKGTIFIFSKAKSVDELKQEIKEIGEEMKRMKEKQEGGCYEKL